MKNLFALCMLLLATSVFATNGNPAPKPIIVEKSTVEWKGYKVTGSHTGTIAVKGGDIDFDDAGMLSGGSFIIDMTTIKNTDMTGKGSAKLEGHLSSDDFFGIATHPEAKLAITKVVSRGKAGEYKIVANLTIKNITKEIKFNAMVADGTATADIVIDRSDFNIKYGSGSFIDNLGDKTIYDEFDLSISLAY